MKRRTPKTEADYGKVTRDLIQSGHHIKYDRKNRGDYTAYKYNYRPSSKREEWTWGQAQVPQQLPQLKFPQGVVPDPTWAGKIFQWLGPWSYLPPLSGPRGEYGYDLGQTYRGFQAFRRGLDVLQRYHGPTSNATQTPSQSSSQRHTQNRQNLRSSYNHSRSAYRYIRNYHRFKRSEKVRFPITKEWAGRFARPLPPGVEPDKTTKKKRERRDKDDKHNRPRRYHSGYAQISLTSERLWWLRKKGKKGYRDRYRKKGAFSSRTNYPRHNFR